MFEESIEMQNCILALKYHCMFFICKILSERSELESTQVTRRDLWHGRAAASSRMLIQRHIFHQDVSIRIKFLFRDKGCSSCLPVLHKDSLREPIISSYQQLIQFLLKCIGKGKICGSRQPLIPDTSLSQQPPPISFY